MTPSFAPEKDMREKYGPFIAGVDEVGRGPLCGPVVTAAALILDESAFVHDFSGVNDSKKLTPAKREILFERLIASPFIVFALGESSVEEIDALNIRQATLLAMRRALRALRHQHLVSAYLVDGNADPYGPDFLRSTYDKEDCVEREKTALNVLPRPVGECLIKGDAQSATIATASILAKVTRDRLMESLAQKYPGYGWERNAGYGTAEHLAALQTLGPTPYHRRSFAPVRTALGL